LPPGIPLDYIRFIEKPQGAYDDFIYIIFKCKKNCDTILTAKNILTMNNFTAELTKDPLWA
jgi:hypothetical protein